MYVHVCICIYVCRISPGIVYMYVCTMYVCIYIMYILYMYVCTCKYVCVCIYVCVLEVQSKSKWISTPLLLFPMGSNLFPISRFCICGLPAFSAAIISSRYFLHTYIHKYIHTCSTYIHTHIHKHRHYIKMDINICNRAQTNSCAQLYIHTYIQTCMHT